MTEATEFIKFYYPLQDIAEEVFKKTSFMAKDKANEDGNAKVTTEVLHKDYRQLLDTFIKDAFHDILSKLSSFTNRIEGRTNLFRSYDTEALYMFATGLVVQNGNVVKNETTDVYYEAIQDDIVLSTEADLLDELNFVVTPTFELIEFYIERKDWFNENTLNSLDHAIQNYIINKSISEWLEIRMTQPNLLAVFTEKARRDMIDVMNRANSQKKKIDRIFRPF